MSFTRAPVTTTRHRTAQVRALVQLAALRARFAVLEHVAPSVGAAEALDLWCTLPDNAGRRRDQRPGPGQVIRLPVRRGGQVVAESWGSGPTVYLVHGWGGWRGQLGAFIAPLVDAGHRVVGFDAPSHGDSDPGAMGVGRGNVMELMEPSRPCRPSSARRTASSRTPWVAPLPAWSSCRGCRPSAWC